MKREETATTSVIMEWMPLTVVLDREREIEKLRAKNII